MLSAYCHQSLGFGGASFAHGPNFFRRLEFYRNLTDFERSGFAPASPGSRL